MATSTIQLDRTTKAKLEGMKLHPRETYEEVIQRILEDLSELSEETKRELEQARREIRAGKFKTHEQVRAEMGF